MRVRPSLDKHRIRTPEDARYYAAGIPSQHWYDDPRVRFRPFKIHELASVTPVETQETVAASLFSETKTELVQPHLVFACSPDHETLITGWTYSLLKHVLGLEMRVQIDNAATFTYEQDGEYDEPVAALVNISTTGSADRRQRIRDWVYAYESSFRILAVSGDPSDAVTYLGIRPTLAFSLTPAPTVVKT